MKKRKFKTVSPVRPIDASLHEVVGGSTGSQMLAGAVAGAAAGATGTTGTTGTTPAGSLEITPQLYPQIGPTGLVR